MSKQDEPDPLIDEIHEIRRRIFAEHGNDLTRLCEHYMEYQKQFADRLISAPPPDLQLLLRAISEDDEDDPLIDEIRETRRKIWKGYGIDVDRVVEHYKQHEKQSAGRLISTPSAASKKSRSAA